MFLLNGAPLSPDVAFTTADGTQYPANWLRLASPQERAAIGITEVPDPPTWDQRWAWGYDSEGHLIWKDHDQLVEQWSEQTRTTANTLLQPSDWQVIREADNGKIMDPALKQLRQDIRLATGSKVQAINNTTTTEELAAYITGADYPTWPPYPEPVVDGPDTIAFFTNSTSSGF